MEHADVSVIKKNTINNITQYYGEGLIEIALHPCFPRHVRYVPTLSVSV